MNLDYVMYSYVDDCIQCFPDNILPHLRMMKSKHLVVKRDEEMNDLIIWS